MKLRRRAIGALIALGLVAAFFLPVVPASAIAPSSPSAVPPVNVGVLTDPTGTYQFTYLGNGTYSMNYTAYQKLLRDPYTGVSATNITIAGNKVLMTVPATNVTSGFTSLARSLPVPPPAGGLESVTSSLSGYGAILVKGGYHLQLWAQVTRPSMPSTPSIPPPLISYASEHSESDGCASGTLNPFRITSTSCPTGPNLVINGGPASTGPSASNSSSN